MPAGVQVEKFMETRAHHVLIGLFTLGAGAAALAFTLWLSGSMTREYQRYDILFQERVSGLTAGSPVQYSGIRVGEVESLNLDPNDPGRVWAQARISSDVGIREGTRARLTLLNITGATGIELSHGDGESPLLDPSPGQIPVIEAEPSPMSQLRLSSDELLVNMTTLMESANRVLSEENTEYLTQVLGNLDAMSGVLLEQQDVLRDGVQDLVEAGTRVNRVLALLEAQIEEHADPLLRSATSAMNQIEQLGSEVEQLLQESRPAIDSGLQGVAEVEPAMQEVRAILESVRALVQRVEDDPGGFLFGSEQMREFRP